MEAVNGIETISGKTESGRWYFNLVISEPELFFAAHAALTYELGPEDRFTKRLGERVGKMYEGHVYDAPLVLRGMVAHAADAGLIRMLEDEHDGFSEMIAANIDGTSDYEHMHRHDEPVAA